MATHAEIERAFWDDHAREYEPIREEAYEELFWFAEPLPQVGTALEVGCGSGSLGRRLKARHAGLAVIGIDIAPNFLNFYPFRAAAADGTAMPFSSNSYDLVVFPAALHHMHPWQNAIREAIRLLKPEGVLLMYETNIHHPWRRFSLSDSMRSFFLETTDEALDGDRIASHLAEKGFHNVRIGYSSLAPAKPKVLGKIHGVIDQIPRPKFMERYLRPWFFLRAERR